MNVLICLIITLASCEAKLNVVKAWLSDPSEQKKDISALLRPTEVKNSALENHIMLTTEQRQVFEGIGGSFMRAGAKVLNQMPPETQEDILQDLFDQGDRGARFTVGKVPIAATDFAPPKWYSYADEEQDESMPDFSIIDLDERALSRNDVPLKLLVKTFASRLPWIMLLIGCSIHPLLCLT